MTSQCSVLHHNTERVYIPGVPLSAAPSSSSQLKRLDNYLDMANQVMEAPAIVIDNGSRQCKAGMAGMKRPSVRIHLPLKVETSRNNDLVQRPRNVHLVNPVVRGLVCDWDALEDLWNHVFSNELGVNPGDHNLMLADPPLNLRATRDTTAEIAFEVFRCPALHIAHQPTLSLFSSGRVSGMVVEVGEGVTHCTPCSHGYVLPHATTRMNLAGGDVTILLQNLLRADGVNLGDNHLMNNMKKGCCYVPLDFAGQTVLEDQVVDFKLPDGNHVLLGQDLRRCPEILFQPALIGGKTAGLVQHFYDAIKASDASLHDVLFRNVVLAGGAVKTRGFHERMYRDISIRASPGFKTDVFVHPQPIHAVWLGGSMVAGLPEFNTLWVSLQDYNEHGAHVIHRKFY
uniref:actin-5-like n=1 Tax=Myxine glutinosa TaxID=7769 RepID=UPI00358FDA19